MKEKIIVITINYIFYLADRYFSELKMVYVTALFMLLFLFQVTFGQKSYGNIIVPILNYS